MTDLKDITKLLMDKDPLKKLNRTKPKGVEKKSKETASNRGNNRLDRFVGRRGVNTEGYFAVVNFKENSAEVEVFSEKKGSYVPVKQDLPRPKDTTEARNVVKGVIRYLVAAGELEDRNKTK